MKIMKRVLITMLVVACWCTAVFAGTSEEVRFVRLSYYDGTEYLVSNFVFYSSHMGVTGSYFKSTKDKVQPLLVNTGKLWYEVEGEDVLTIRLEPDTSGNSLKAYIELKGGRTLSGNVPRSVSQTWESGDYFWIQGITTKFGKPASFKVKVGDIVLVETLKDPPKQFTIKTKQGEDMTVQAVKFGLYGNMPYSRPFTFGLSSSVKLKSEGLDVNIPLEDILSFTFDEKGKITMMMKNGDTGTVSFVDVRRIYGRLKTGEILFDSISSPEGAKIKSIEFPKPTGETK